MRIAIIGAGGVGGYFGGKLAQAGNDVTFVARGEHLRAMREKGLIDKIKATKSPRAQPRSSRSSSRKTSSPASRSLDYVWIRLRGSAANLTAFKRLWPAG